VAAHLARDGGAASGRERVEQPGDRGLARAERAHRAPACGEHPPQARAVVSHRRGDARRARGDYLDFVPMRTWVVAASALAALAVTASPAAAPTSSPLLGIVLDGGQGHLARLDPDTLRSLRRSSFLTNGYAVAPALSPDGSTVALGSTSFIGLRLVDVTSLKAIAEVRLRLSGAHVAASSWPSPTRIVVAAVHANPASVIFVNIDPK